MRGALATKQSIVSLRGGMDCFAALAMTRSESVPTSGKRLVRSLPSLRHSAPHCAERCDEAIHLLCCAHALLHQTLSSGAHLHAPVALTITEALSRTLLPLSQELPALQF